MSSFGVLMKYEWKKLFQKKMVCFAVLSVLALQIVGNLSFLMSGESLVIVDENGNQEEVVAKSGYEKMVEQKEDALALDGRVIDGALMQEMHIFLENYKPGDRNRYLDIYNIVNFMESGIWHRFTGDLGEMEELSEEMYSLWKTRLVQDELGRQYLARGEREYWEKRIDNISTPFTYRYCFAWKNILEHSLSISVMVLMLLAISLSGIFSDEHRLKTDQLILCMKNGREYAYFAKIAVGTLFAAACTLLLWVIDYGICFFLYGTRGFQAVMQQLGIVCFDISIGQAVLILSGISLLAGILEGAFAMLLSEWLNNSVAVMALLVGLMLLTQVVAVPESWRVISQAWELMPTCLIAPWRFLDGRLVRIFGGYLTNFQFAGILYPALTLVFIWLGKGRYRRFQVTGR